MKLLKVKIESFIFLLYLPTLILNIVKAEAIIYALMQLLIVIGFLYAIKEVRKETIIKIEQGEYEEQIKEIKKAIASFRRIKNTIAKQLEDIKKEVIGSKLKTTKLKDAL